MRCPCTLRIKPQTETDSGSSAICLGLLWWVESKRENKRMRERENINTQWTLEGSLSQWHQKHTLQKSMLHTMHCSPTFSYSLKCKRFDWSFFSFLKQALQVKWYFPLCFFYHINTFLSSVIVSKVQLNQPMLKAQVSKNIYVEYQTQYD